MRNMTKLFVVTAIIVGVTAGSATAETISLNWKQYAGAVNDALDGYGVVPANNWQNLQQVRDATDLPLNDGATSTVDLVSSVNGPFQTYDFSGTLNNTPMRAGMSVYSDFPDPISFTLSELSATFVEYDIIVYVSGYNAATGGNIGSITDGASTFVYSVPNPFDATLTQSTDIDANDGADAATYVRFDGLTADSVTITLSALNGSAAFGGFQVTGTLVPEPTTVITTLAALVLLIRHR